MFEHVAIEQSPSDKLCPPTKIRADFSLIQSVQAGDPDGTYTVKILAISASSII